MRKKTNLLLNIFRFIFSVALGTMLFISFITFLVAWSALG